MNRLDTSDGLVIDGKRIYRSNEYNRLGRTREEKEAEIERRVKASNLHRLTPERFQVHLFDDGSIALREYRNEGDFDPGEWWVQKDDPFLPRELIEELKRGS